MITASSYIYWVMVHRCTSYDLYNGGEGIYGGGRYNVVGSWCCFRGFSCIVMMLVEVTLYDDYEFWWVLTY